MKKKLLSVIFVIIALGGVILTPSVRSAVDQTYEQLKTLMDILDCIRNNYVEERDTKTLIYGAASGMVKTLDPFSQFMEPEVHKEMKAETEGQFGGLGIRITIKEGWLTVQTPIPGTPAYRMGILPNDRIIKIEGESTKDITLYDAVKKLRGPPGTKVAITIVREQPSTGTVGGIQPPTPKDVSITREWIKIESTFAKKMVEDIGYIRIHEFNTKTSGDFSKNMEAMKAEGIKTLVLDLRNNPGGLLSAAVEICQKFLGGNKLIVYTQGRRPESRQEFRSLSHAPYEDIPLVVLVNAGSASGSEIVAGAFQDHRRALIIGSQTFGKASVQSVIPLSDGSGLRITTAKYYTPLGRSIQKDEKAGKGGITPDIAIEANKEMEEKLQKQSDLVYTPGKPPESTVKPEERVKDEVLDRAVEILKAREVLSHIKGG